MKSVVRSRSSLVLVALGIVCLFLPAILGEYLIHVMILIFFYAYLGQCWNILGGYAGQLSIGHAAYYGIGAYTSTLLFTHLGLTPWLGMIAGGVAAMMLGLFTGYLCFRFGLKGPYFALATLGFAEILRLICLNMTSIGGAQGILIPLLGQDFLKFQFMERKFFYYIVFGMLILSIAVVTRIEKSRMGYYFRALHQNEDAAEALGIDITRYKLIAVGLSSFLTALGGTFYAQYTMYIEPEIMFGSFTSVDILLRTIIGGAGTVYGPVIGSFILTPVSEIMRNVVGGGKSGINIMVFGIIVMLICIFMQKGILPWLKARVSNYFGSENEDSASEYVIKEGTS